MKDLPASNQQDGTGPKAAKPKLADLATRIGSALVLIVLAILSLWHSGQSFILFWLFAAVLVHWEWQHMIGGERVLLNCLIGTCALAAAAALRRVGDLDYPLLILLAGAVALAVSAGKGRRLWASAGLLYAGALIISLDVLRFSMPGFFRHMAIIWLFAVVWGTDIMAYFGGRLIGGPKLWPRISPSKTWSGTLTGIISGAFLGVGAIYFYERWNVLPDTQLAFSAIFLLGLIIGAAAQAGDLMESAMKRHFNVKDSSHLIPGHGGFMDRLDGFIIAVVVAACIGSLRFGSALAVNGLFQW